MTYRNGRHGRKYNRSGMADPSGPWAKGVPASAGYYPAQGVRFAGTNDPLNCDARNMPHCAETEGRVSRHVQTKAGGKPGTNGLSRQGAQATRGANRMIRGQSRRFAATSLKPKAKGLRRKSRK